MMEIKDNSLSSDDLDIIRNKATEKPYSGNYNTNDDLGTYLCRACGLALFRASAKFSSSCGWPSFDEALEGRVLEQMDKDGQRTEILCGRCQAHLGHIFSGEGWTAKNLRYCVNARSLDFVADQKILDTEEAILAAGCFWGVEYYMKRLPGVVKTQVGYIGGHVESPSYDQVCHGATGHYEAIRVLYDPLAISYEQILKYFFEIHDPSQIDGQGPDKGQQYQSGIFYYDKSQYDLAEKVMKLLTTKGFRLATQLLPVKTFWPAEDFHQDYYKKNQHTPYCHTYTKRFE